MILYNCHKVQELSSTDSPPQRLSGDFEQRGLEGKRGCQWTVVILQHVYRQVKRRSRSPFYLKYPNQRSLIFSVTNFNRVVLFTNSWLWETAAKWVDYIFCVNIKPYSCSGWGNTSHFLLPLFKPRSSSSVYRWRRLHVMYSQVSIQVGE